MPARWRLPAENAQGTNEIKYMIKSNKEKAVSLFFWYQPLNFSGRFWKRNLGNPIRPHVRHPLSYGDYMGYLWSFYGGCMVGI